MGDDSALARMRQHCQQRLGSLRNERASFWAHWTDIATFIFPRRFRWLVSANQLRGQPINGRIIDETATLALRTLASGMMAGVTSPGKPWFRLALPDTDAGDSSPTKIWLDAVVKRVLRAMAESNYYTAKATQYGDLAAFGTAPMIIYEDSEDIFRCYTPCAGEFFVGNDEREAVGILYREMTRTVEQVVREFGEGAVSPGLLQSFQQGGAALQREVLIGHAIERNDRRVGGGLVPALFSWREVYWEIGASGDTVLRARGFHEQPFSAPRWDLSGSDAYGRSPAMDALGGCKQLQQETKRKGQVIDKLANPPMIGDVSLSNSAVSLLPGGITYVANIAGVGLKPAYEVNPAAVQHIREDIGEVQQRIKSVFFTDLFLMISQLDTVRTATEIDARREEKLIQLGPVLERFQQESLDIEVDRIFAIMVRSSEGAWMRGQDGLLPMPPPDLHGQSLQVEYVSMLAEAQRAASTAAIERLAQFVGNLAAADPAALDNLDMDEMVDTYADLLGVDAKVVRATAQVAQIRQGRAQQMQAQQMAQTGMAAVQGAQTLSQTDVGGGQNALQMMMGGGGMQRAA